jgi:hypothetical protein
MTIWTQYFKQATFALYMYLMCTPLLLVHPMRIRLITWCLFLLTSLSLPHFIHLLVNSILKWVLCVWPYYHTVKTWPNFFLCICGYLPQVELSWRLRSMLLWVCKVLPLVGPFPNGKDDSCVRTRSKLGQMD